jgi:protein gp37
MTGKSNIEWTEATWNPVVGCSIVSPGCTNCYAMKMAARIEAMSEAIYDAGKRTAPAQYCGTTKKVNGSAVWTGKVARAGRDVLTSPLRRKKPTTYFVNSMGDLFHEDVPDAWIDDVFAIMALSPQHTFQVLTKRAQRMRDYMLERWQPMKPLKLDLGGGDIVDLKDETEGADRRDQIVNAIDQLARDDKELQRRFLDTENDAHWTDAGAAKVMQFDWPLANVWLGVSTERQQEADERIPLLLQTPAAVRFISAEPLLGPLDLASPLYTGEAGITMRGYLRNHAEPDDFHHHATKLDWVIAGGESGRNARPMHIGWARDLCVQCETAGVPFFFKQHGEWHPRGDKPGIAETCIAINGAISRGDELKGGPDKRPRWIAIERVGKKKAGRLLDGVTHDAMPSRQIDDQHTGQR